MTVARRVLKASLAASLLLIPAVSFAADEAKKEDHTAAAESAESKAAADLVSRYLAAVKAKKWADAKKFVHPKTIDAIAERKKRLGKEDHPLAPQTFEK